MTFVSTDIWQAHVYKLNHSTRSLPEELCRSQPCQKRIWLYSQPEASGPFQSVFFGQQEFDGANLGMSLALLLCEQDVLTLLQPVRVTPEAYYLFDTPATGVSELCDAFKVRYALI